MIIDDLGYIRQTREEMGKRPDIPYGEGSRSGVKIASWFLPEMQVQGVGYAGGGR